MPSLVGSRLTGVCLRDLDKVLAWLRFLGFCTSEELALAMEPDFCTLCWELKEMHFRFNGTQMMVLEFCGS